MFGKVTNAVLESRLKCKYKAHLKMAGEQGQPHEYELMLKDSRDHVRASATATLLARHLGQEVPQGLPVNAELLKRGLPLLLDTTIEDGDLSIRFDALLRVEGKSRLGGFHYAPVLFHEAEKPTPDLRVILAAFAELLAPFQGSVPARATLVHGSGCRERKVKLACVAKQARRLLRELREARDGPAPRLTLNDHCQACEFRKRCHAEAVARDDLSLLRGINEAEIAKYAKRGILTVAQLACTFRPPRRTKKQAQRKPVHSHALQALSIRERKVHVLGGPELPASAKRIYFDIEGDPDRSFDYLIGVVVQDGEKEERHSFWIDSPGEEARLLDRFLDLAARHPDAWLYAYGYYEAAFLRRVGKATGREEEVGKVLTRTFNVLSVVYLHVYFPVQSNGLKDIAGHLGFRWTDPEASGIQSIVWRRRWEKTRSVVLKDTLTTYNLEDCDALKKVTEFLYATCPAQSPPKKVSEAGFEITRAEDIGPQGARPGWGDMAFALPDFSFVNERAYFDYQRDKVFVRSSKTLRRSRGRQRAKRWKRNHRVNREVEISSKSCPCCGGTELERRQNGSLSRLAFDLRITRSGIKRWVTRYRTAWHHCAGCGKRFLPGEYIRLKEFCHSLKSWAMYEHVAHRASLPNIADTIRECFNLPIDHTQVHAFKRLLADYYQGTYKRLLEKIVSGALVHVDETEVHVRRVGKAYVWVFTNLEEVVYLYRPSREGGFLRDLLKDFRGVLVSDFYAAYDSLDCPQQKCLIHLLRDFNQDIVSNPWDEELKSLAAAFGSLLRTVVATIDQYGLRQRHLDKHRRDAVRFLQTSAAESFRSEVAEGYRKRLQKYRDKLFTFLDHDGVPWNNNNAEHAVKGFAYYREVADNLLTEAGLNQYLVLLSVYQTCKYKGVSFLKFLLSGETDIDVFRESGGNRVLPAIELYPEGTASNRKRLGLEAAGE
jgi:predicted RecB family nuclease